MHLTAVPEQSNPYLSLLTKHLYMITKAAVSPSDDTGRAAIAVQVLRLVDSFQLEDHYAPDEEYRQAITSADHWWSCVWACVDLALAAVDVRPALLDQPAVQEAIQGLDELMMRHVKVDTAFPLNRSDLRLLGMLHNVCKNRGYTVGFKA